MSMIYRDEKNALKPAFGNVIFDSDIYKLKR